MFIKIEDLTVEFGGLRALNKLNIQIEKKEILGLIGPNGAGKTTLFNTLAGVCKPSSGEIFFEGKKITGFKPNQIASLGILRTFQLTKLFLGVTVSQQILIGQHLKNPGSIILNRQVMQEKKESLRKANDLLEFMNLLSVKDECTANISSAQQRKLMIATALAAEPKILLLDEPTAGMSAEETAEVVKLISDIRHLGITVVLIEHNMKVTMNICDRIFVLNQIGRAHV